MMKSKLLETINQTVAVSNELSQQLINRFEKRNIPKGEILLKEYQISRHLYFIESGLVRTYYYHKDKEITSWFYGEGQFATSWYSFYSTHASFEFIETIEDSTVYALGKDNFKDLMDSFREFERFARILAEQQLGFIDFYSKGYNYLSAREKYDDLLRYIPDIELRVKLGQIASFLGISQETLSRLRSSK